MAEGKAYLSRYPAHQYSDEVSLNLMQALLPAGRMDEAQAIGRKALQLNPHHRFLDQVRYLLAFIDFQKQDYETARAAFTEILTRWPRGVYAEAAEYWRAMCNLFLSQYAEAASAFEAYLNNPEYPKKSFAEDASYRLGVALYGQGDSAGAESAFQRFLAAYPRSALQSEAFCMIGDLRVAAGEPDAALEFYRKGLACAVNKQQVNYSVFQTAKVYEQKKDYPALVEWMETYLKDRGAEADFAAAGFWTGKAYAAMNQYDKAMTADVDAVIRCGGDPANDFLDLILRELVQILRSGQVAEADRIGFINTLTEALQQAEARGDTTLALRLQTLFAYMTDGEKREPYISAILKDGGSEQAAAFTLQLLAEESLRQKDYARVHNVYALCMAGFKGSDLLPDVMNVELAARIQEAEYPAAIALAEEITARFGYSPPIGLTRKLKADAQRLSGQVEEAIQTYNELFAVREWRGSLTPEALYWIGVCLESQGKFDEAFAFFQRVYVLYEGYPDWSAKAYEGSFQCLEKLGRRADAVKTLQEMLSKPDVAATPEGARARTLLTSLVANGGKK